MPGGKLPDKQIVVLKAREDSGSASVSVSATASGGTTSSSGLTGAVINASHPSTTCVSSLHNIPTAVTGDVSSHSSYQIHRSAQLPAGDGKLPLLFFCFFSAYLHNICYFNFYYPLLCIHFRGCYYNYNISIVILSSLFQVSIKERKDSTL